MMDKDTREESRSFLADALVLDLAEEEGAFCSKLLSDLGATVIKVESPSGDPARRGRDETANPAFLYHNANKFGLSIDPGTPEDLTLLRGLVEEADVVIDTLSRGRAEALGMAPEHTLKLNPALVHLSISGFGGSGPKAAFRWSDEIVSAFGGQVYLTGPRSGPPRPLPKGQPLYASSLLGAVAVLLALRQKRLTGMGRRIDLSAQEAIASTLDHVMVDYFRDGTICRRQGNLYGDGSFAILPAADGHMLVSLSTDWETLRELMAAEGKANDLSGEEWQDPAHRALHIDRVVGAVGEWTRGHSREELFSLGQAMRFPWAPMYTTKEVVESPQLAARRFFLPSSSTVSTTSSTTTSSTSSSTTSVETGGGPASLPGLPYRFRSFLPPPSRRAPRHGEHNILFRHGADSILEGLRKKTHPDSAGQFPGGESRDTRGPVLHGIRVIDFTWMLAGPYATRVLADFGAEVIKVQSVRAKRSGEGSDPAYDAAWNRNKRSIVLDLERPEAREIVSRLVSGADVVVENFSPRVMANWGFSYDELREAKPDIVMASISAMGQTGPWKDYVGFGPTFHALSGLVSEASHGLAIPACPGHAYGDTIIGLYAALAILAALERKEATGRGEYIDLSGFEALCTLLGPALIEAGTDDPGGPGDGERVRRGADHAACYPCQGEDRWCVIAFQGERDWERFCIIAGLADVADVGGERLSAPGPGEVRWDERDALAASWTAGHAPEHVVDVLQSGGLAAAVVQDARDVARDPQLLFRDFFVSLDHPTLGTLRSDRSALPLDDLRRRKWKAAPLPGEDNEYVLGHILGFSREEIGRYAAEGVIE